jgi:hypothetical protein
MRKNTRRSKSAGGVTINPVPLPVRDVDNSARQPFHADASFVLEAARDRGEKSFRFQISPTELVVVPKGKRGIIEYFSCRCELQPGQRVNEVRLVTFVNGFELAQYIVPTPQGQLPSESPSLGVPIVEVFAASQMIREYADPGTGIRFMVKRSPSSGVAGCSALISGYFVNLP